MRNLLFLVMTLLCLAKAEAQQPEHRQDSSSVLLYAEEMPRFPGCELPDSSIAFRQKCSEALLFDYLYSRLVYPPEASEQGLEGTVVVSFVVNTDGRLSDFKVMRDIGGGCGEEVLRILRQMEEEGIRWRPGYQDGRAVAVRFNLPVRFEIQEPLPYALVRGDTVYVEIDSLPRFKGGDEALARFLEEHLTYPEQEGDTCLLGDMNVEILIQPDGFVKVLDVLDYHGLGFEYQFKAIELATATSGQWVPAIYQGRFVPTTYMLYLFFEPQGKNCSGMKAAYEQAQEDSVEGLRLFNEGQQEEGLALLNRAIEAFPYNANFRYTRAQMYISRDELEKACEDLTVVRQNMVLPMVEQLFPLICR